MCANVYADLKMLQIDFLETLDFFVDRKLRNFDFIFQFLS